MRFVNFRSARGEGLAVKQPGDGYVGWLRSDSDFPGDLASLVQAGSSALQAAAVSLGRGPAVDLAAVQLLPPLSAPGKILCIGLNYVDHSAESGFKVPDYPTVFVRFASCLIGHGASIIRPAVSTQLDYEGELVAVIGKGGRHIPEETALQHVAGYSIFNDASVRDYQFKSPQWTIGKNFDATGAFGPEFVTADELPLGCHGLRLQTRLNGEVLQDASTADMVFTVAKLVSILSEAMTLSPGDIIVTGTPAGVGLARKPPRWMKAGDVCEIEIEQIGTLRNVVADEAEPIA